MEEIVEDAVKENRKVVIFSNWSQIVIPAFERLSKKYSGVMITGETKDNERQSYVDRFQNDDRVKFIIGTIGAMGKGYDLFSGSIEIFLDDPWNMETKNQAIDRCHRIGATSNITIYTLICKGTIDDRVQAIINRTGEISDIMTGNTIKGDKTELINYLLS
jgi:non-specific serine/threonine protein kinase